MPVGYELHRLFHTMNRMLRNSSAHASIARATEMHGYLIRYLAEHQDSAVFQKDIEKQFSISPSHVSYTLKTMEKNGMIIRETVLHDARLKQIRLTQKALELHQQIEQEICAFETRITEGLTEEECQMFLAVIQKMRRNLEDTEESEKGSFQSCSEKDFH